MTETPAPIHTLPIPISTRAKRFFEKHKQEIMLAAATAAAGVVTFYVFKKGTEALVARGTEIENDRELDQLIKEYTDLNV